MRGRKPVPAAVKRLRGTGTNTGRILPLVPASIPTCPAFLDTEGKRCWKRLIKTLGSMGVLSAAYRETLAGLCHNYSLFVRTSEQVNDTDWTDSATVRRWTQVAAKAYENYSRAALEFGLTPLSRERVPCIPPTGKSDKSRFFPNPFHKYMDGSKGG